MIQLLALIAPYAVVALLGGGLVAWIEGKDLAVARSHGAVITAEAKVSAADARAKVAERIASLNEDASLRLSKQAGVDATAFDRRLAAVREEAALTARAREAIAREEGRAEGAASAICPSPEAPLQSALRGDVRRPVPREAIPPQIQAAIDALTSEAKPSRRHR